MDQRERQPGPEITGRVPGSRTFPFTISPLSYGNASAAARLYAEVFLHDEPTTRHHAPDPASFSPLADFYVRTLVDQELSFVAQHEVTGELSGFIFAFDLTHDPASDGEPMVRLIGSFQNAVAMIDELEDRHLNRAGIEPGTVLHIFQIGTAGNHRGAGLAPALIRHLLDHARVRGYRSAIADCTGPVSKSVFERCGFVELGHSPYADFRHNGRVFFSGLPGGISLLKKDL
ncbi:MAG: GNAT family N-acetyltransferase [Methanoregula sp.]